MTDPTGASGNTFVEKYLTPVAVILGAVIIALVLLLNHGGQAVQQAATNGQQPAAVAVNIKNLKTDNEPYIGNPNAPVTIGFFFDYQCPFCKQDVQTVVAQLYTNYVQTGKLRIVFKDFQFLGNDSNTGAEYGRAVWATYPNLYYTWYLAMFNAQDEEGDKGFGNAATIQALIKTIPGMDEAKVQANLDANKAAYDTAIAADRSEGASYGIQGTPSILVGTTLLQGAQTYAAVSALVDAQLKK